MEKYLRKCLDSLIIYDNELLKSLEVLVINDGSKDSSSAIAHEYEQSYPEIFRIIDKENGNYGSCINRGLREATGKYIKVLDADDSFDTKNFSILLKDMAAVDADMFISDYILVSEKDIIKEKRNFSLPQKKILDIKDCVRGIASIQMHAVSYKTENLRDMNYYQTEGISYTDTEWIFSPICMVKKIYYTGNIVYKYLIGRQGQTVQIQTFHKRISERVTLVKDLIGFYNKYRINQQDFICNYLKEQMLRHIHGIYLSYLFVNRDLDGALSFDNFLQKGSLDLYMASSDIHMHKHIKYQYIKRWRATHKLPPRYISNLYMVYILLRQRFNS